MLSSCPLFSIVIPVFNSRSTIGKCVDSVIAQDYSNYEIVLVDDGSFDGTEQICDDYDNAYAFVHVIHQENKGSTNARKTGALFCQGEYIVLLDCDDWLEPDYLYKASRIIKKDDPDLICFQIVWHYPNNTNIIKQSVVPDGFYPDFRLDPQARKYMMMSSEGSFIERGIGGKLFKKQLFLKCISSVPDEIITGEDMCCLICALLGNCSVTISNDSHYHYRVAHGTQSHKGNPEAFQNTKTIIQYLNAVVPKDEDLRKQFYRLIIQQTYSASIRMVANGVSLKKLYSGFAVVESLSEFKEALVMADFSSLKMNSKKYLLKYKLLHLIFFFFYCRKGWEFLHGQLCWNRRATKDIV